MIERQRCSPADVELLDAVTARRITDYRSPVTSSDLPADTENWGDQRTVSASASRAIIDEAISAFRPAPVGVRIIADAIIAGEPKLASLQIPYPLELIGYLIDDPIRQTQHRNVRIIVQCVAEYWGPVLMCNG